MTWLKVTLILLIANEGCDSWRNETCFSALGCFSLQPPWRSLSRPVPDPMHPQLIATRLNLFTRSNPIIKQELPLYPTVNISCTNFDVRRTLFFIIHGFATNGRALWMRRMKDALLNRRHANVVVVDWGKGAQLLNYYQVASNTRVVARELLRFVTRANVMPKLVHVIGHSIGAHVGAYLGKELKNMGRITALDPARPAFEGFDSTVRLDASDAQLVDVVHTFARSIVPGFGIGMVAPHGDIDFYMNGGMEQPGCPENRNIDRVLYGNFEKLQVEQIINSISCSHSRAIDYFYESLKSTECLFWGRNLTYFDYLSFAYNLYYSRDVELGSYTIDCDMAKCIPLGLESNRSKIRGSVLIKTHHKAPFCSDSFAFSKPIKLSRPELVKTALSSGLNKVFEYISFK